MKLMYPVLFCSQCRILREQWRMRLYLQFWRCTRFIGIFIDPQRIWRAAVAENMNFPRILRAESAKYWEIDGKIYLIGNTSLTNSFQDLYFEKTSFFNEIKKWRYLTDGQVIKSIEYDFCLSYHITFPVWPFIYLNVELWLWASCPCFSVSE